MTRAVWSSGARVHSAGVTTSMTEGVGGDGFANPRREGGFPPLVPMGREPDLTILHHANSTPANRTVVQASATLLGCHTTKAHARAMCGPSEYTTAARGTVCTKRAKDSSVCVCELFPNTPLKNSQLSQYMNSRTYVNLRHTDSERDVYTGRPLSQERYCQ